MSAYRIPAHTDLDAPTPPRRRVLPWALIATAALHVGFGATMFALRAKEPVAPPVAVVTVLSGHVADTGFEAAGMHQARVRLP